ncbi:MAG: hypothetical protein WD176_01865 [Pirellulales bacterium]
MLKQASLGCALAVLLVASAEAQQRRGGGFGGGTTDLLAIPEVRTELKVTDEQASKVEDLARKAAEERRALRPERGAQPSDEERAELRKKGQELSKKTDEELGKILDATQVARLKQLRLQRDGVGALGRTEVADELGLSTEQKDKIAKILGEARGQFGQGGQRGGTAEERRARAEEFRKQREKVQSDITATLTDAQKTKFTEMKGAEFKFPERQSGQSRRRRSAGN